MAASIKSFKTEPCPMNFLGKVMFPHQPLWRARRQARQMLAAFTVALVFGAVVVVVMFLENAKR
jgi:hypothetical protein